MGAPTEGTGDDLGFAAEVLVRELRRAQQTLRAVLDGATDALVLVEEDGSCMDANQAACTLLGSSRDGVLGAKVFDLGGPAASPALKRTWDEALARGRADGEIDVERSEGTRTLEVHGVAHILPGTNLFVFRDVTDRRRASEVQERLASIVASSADAILAHTTDGRITDWNAAAEQLFGYAAAEIIGKPVDVLFPSSHTEELAAVRAALASGQPFRAPETVRRCKDGREIPVSVTMSPLLGRDGRPAGASSSAHDLSETKALRNRLAMADRMASIGMIAAAAAHEINTPLAYVKANVGYALEELSGGPRRVDPEVLEALEHAREGIERMVATVRDLKIFARAEEEPPAPVDVRRVLQSSIHMAWNEVRHRARLVTDLQEVPPVIATESKLGQIFLNLLVNAAQSIPEGAADRHEVRVRTSAADGLVHVEVEDTGVGVATEDLRRLFEPFFTTKARGVGTGLGLSICHGIVTSLGGDITVWSQPGRGTTFRVALPAGNPARASEEDTLPRPAAADDRRRGRVLVIDDEPLLATAIERTLSGEQDVTVSIGAQPALARIEAGERFDLVFCDLMMPVITGIQFYELLLALAPDQAERVVFMTGGAFTQQTREFLERSPNRLLEKPWDPEVLIALARDAVR